MTFKLSKLLDLAVNPSDPFRLYDEYVKANRHKFPQSVLALLENEDWQGGSTSNAPYYSHLQDFELKDFGKPSAEFVLRLNKNMYVTPPFSIEICYQGVHSLDIPSLLSLVAEDDMTHQMVWRYEEFLFYDGYHEFGLKEPMFTHHIEWINGQVWAITGRDVAVRWV